MLKASWIAIYDVYSFNCGYVCHHKAAKAKAAVNAAKAKTFPATICANARYKLDLEYLRTRDIMWYSDTN